ncbi:hypothetical protein B0H11DRAFT_2238057 [Mycena galericulata]|nr:hypothetical protein B0H11DRAFT_2238057 [Mycena galericulata]
MNRKRACPLGPWRQLYETYAQEYEYTVSGGDRCTDFFRGEIFCNMDFAFYSSVVAWSEIAAAPSDSEYEDDDEIPGLLPCDVPPTPRSKGGNARAKL